MARFKYNEFNSRPFESHAVVLSLIKDKSRILEIGSATGYFSKKLIEKDCEVWGIEIDKSAAEKSKHILAKLFIQDINNLHKILLKKKYFDYILLQDILEHITQSKEVLIKIKPYLVKGGKIIISTPNIAHISIRLGLLFGKFDYQETGILDKTHVHFFTKKSILELINRSGYKIISTSYSCDFGQIPIIGRILMHISKSLQFKITKIFPTLLSVQFIIVSTK